jgi:hypothetical protein
MQSLTNQETSLHTILTFSACGLVLGWALYQTQKRLCYKKSPDIPAVPALLTKKSKLEQLQVSINLSQK